MLPYLFHIYGPIYANCYGISIAIGIIIFTYLLDHDSNRKKLINSDQLQELVLWGIILGVIGGRLLWAASNLPMTIYEFFEIWEGGFAVLGSISAILLFVPIYLKKYQIPILPLLDLTSIYAPLLQSISRIGCFLAGCCYGIPTHMPWGIIYTHVDVAVPNELKFIAIHPTQLYSSLILFGSFLLMRYLLSKTFKKPGQLLTSYLMLVCSERFLVDFWRADQEFFDSQYLKLFSFHQWIALGIFVTALILFINCSKKTN